MTCALCGYSTVHTGGGMIVSSQRDIMEDFFHGIPGKKPSQIQMLSEAKFEYVDLFDTTNVCISTKKSSRNRKLKKI